MSLMPISFKNSFSFF